MSRLTITTKKNQEPTIVRTNYPSFIMTGSNKKSLAQLRRERKQAATNQTAVRILMGFNILLYSFLCTSAFH